MFAFAFGDDMANLSTSSSGHTSCHERGVGDYMEGTDLWEQTDAYFCGDGQALAPESGSVLSYSGKWALDGPCIRNAYANYEFSFYGSITLEEVGPVTITPVDMTLYIGGSSDYWEDVDGPHPSRRRQRNPRPPFLRGEQRNPGGASGWHHLPRHRRGRYGKVLEAGALRR